MKEDKKGNSKFALPILIVVILIGLYLVIGHFVNSPAQCVAMTGSNANFVTVCGYVKTSLGTTPISITFGQSYSGSTVTVTNGYYSVNLFASEYGEPYPINVSYSSLTGTQHCGAGVLNLRNTSDTYSYDVAC